LEIINDRKTIVKCFRVFANDEGRKIIRANKQICDNAGVSFGDVVTIRKFVEQAKT
jgi:hypothetical protein